MSIFISGVCGFVGYHTSLSLLRLGTEVIGIDHMLAPDAGLKEMRLSHLSTFPGFRFLKCDLSDHEKIKKALALRKIDIVFHFAGQGENEGDQNVFSYLYHNVTCALNFLELIKDAKIPYVVLPKKQDNETSFYNASILSREAFLHVYRKNHNIKIFDLSLENVFGVYCHNRNTLLDFWKKIDEEDVIYLKTRGNQAKRYVHISQITQKIDEFFKEPREFQEFDGFVLTDIEIIQYLEDITKKQAQIVWGKESYDGITLPKNMTKEKEDDFKRFLSDMSCYLN